MKKSAVAVLKTLLLFPGSYIFYTKKREGPVNKIPKGTAMIFVSKERTDRIEDPDAVMELEYEGLLVPGKYGRYYLNTVKTKKRKGHPGK